MKKKLMMTLLTAAVSVTAFLLPDITAQAEATSEVIKNDESGIPDAALYQAVLKAADGRTGSSADGILTIQEAESLVKLEAPDKKIKNIQGIGYCKGLERLFLQNNNISDISALSDLTNLENLFLHTNNISDISALSDLTNLENLDISDNNVSDISALSGLTKLCGLTLFRDNISDISALSGLTNLQSLGLDTNNISDISALSGLTSLTQLYLENNDINDISALSGLTNLRILCLDNNNISDVSPLSGLVNLLQLDLRNNQIKDISALAGLTQTTIYLDGNPLTGENEKDIPFTDVPADAYYTTPVAWAVEKGITAGTSATTFSPDAECTRGQIVTFLWRAAGCPAPSSTNHPFVDVKAGSYYYDAMLWAVEKGITSGTSATTFSPDAVCTRGQAVTFLYRYAGKPSAEAVTNPFTDIKSGAYYYDSVFWALKQGITYGTSATTFAPDKDCSRGEIVTFLYRQAN